MKILEGKIKVNLCNIGLGKISLDLTPQAQMTKGKIDKLDFIKINVLCFSGYHQQSEKTSHR